MLLVGDYTKTPAVTDRVTEAVRRGRVAVPRLQKAAERVLAAKGYSQARIDCLLGG